MALQPPSPMCPCRSTCALFIVLCTDHFIVDLMEDRVVRFRAAIADVLGHDLSHPVSFSYLYSFVIGQRIDSIPLSSVGSNVDYNLRGCGFPYPTESCRFLCSLQLVRILFGRVHTELCRFLCLLQLVRIYGIH